MNYSLVCGYARRLASGDRTAWRYLPYQIAMNLRGVDLTGVNPSDSGLCQERSFGHRDSGGPDLDRVLRRLSICSSDAVLDVGCGKGGAILTMAKYRFATVDGVELSPVLADIARQNLRRLKVLKATIFTADAAEFTLLDRYTYFYMYNPFPELVMRAVMTNMVRSAHQCRRPITLVYKNPMLHNVIIDSGFSMLCDIGLRLHHPFRVYRFAT